MQRLREGSHHRALESDRRHLEDRHVVVVPAYEEVGGVDVGDVKVKVLQELGGKEQLLDEEAGRGGRQAGIPAAAGQREDVAARHSLRYDADVRLRAEERPQWHEVRVR